MQEEIEGLITRWLPKSLSKDYWIWEKNSKKLAAEITKLFERRMDDINILLVMVIVLFTGLVVLGIMQVIALMALATVRAG